MRRKSLDYRPWAGRQREYDLFRELFIGVVLVGAAILVFAGFVGSPDEPSVTLKSWSQTDPNDFTATAASELAGTSGTAQYGPPYTHASDSVQSIGAFSPQRFSGVRLPIDTARADVLTPLAVLDAAPTALAQWNAASASTQDAWASAYDTAMSKAPNSDPSSVKPGDYGPVPAMLHALLASARTGALDAAIHEEGGFFSTDQTSRILFLGDGTYFPGLSAAMHLTGDQWGMMNETGDYPGQSWLWLFSFWYQVPAIGGLANADLVIVGIMLVLTVLLMLVPFIPGLRDLPRWIPVHRLVWRDFYGQQHEKRPPVTRPVRISPAEPAADTPGHRG